ncbi:DUF86 domain-containing protein [Candidatus Woesearchaeota archaeon]|nr:MAG: DUF86 domain-containing protein [Candidatus Woesearchaeota archaeon]
MKEDSFYIKHIAEAIKKIEEYAKNKTQFQQNTMIQDATIRQIEIIGEATKKISQKTKQKYNLPWKDIAGMRDKLIHEYFGVDIAAVWKTVENDLPILKKEIEKMVKNDKL